MSPCKVIVIARLLDAQTQRHGFVSASAIWMPYLMRAWLIEPAPGQQR
jgi:hypothetical protein